MTTYAVSGVSAAAASAAAYATFNAGSTRRAKIRELGLFTRAATASNIVVGHPANEGTPPVASTSIVPVAHDPADTAAALARLGTAWSTAPTAPSVSMRAATLGAAVGAGVIWKLALDELIVLGLSGWLAIWNPTGGATGSALDVYVEHEE